MDRKRIFLLIGLAVVGFLVFTQLQKLGTPNQAPVVAATSEPVVEQIEYVDVLVSTQEIPYGTRLNSDHFSWKQWPVEAITPDFITNDMRPQAITELSGGVARSIIFQSEPISERKIVMPGKAGLMSSLLSPGMRAITQRISVDTAAGGFIQPGDRVDIILTVSSTNIAPGQPTASEEFDATTIFENVRVLAIDQTFSTSSDSGAAVIGSTATFEMSQEDSEILAQSAAQGDITLTLRPMSVNMTAPGKSHAKVQKEDKEITSVVLYRNGQPQSVAVSGN